MTRLLQVRFDISVTDEELIRTANVVREDRSHKILVGAMLFLPIGAGLALFFISRSVPLSVSLALVLAAQLTYLNAKANAASIWATLNLAIRRAQRRGGLISNNAEDASLVEKANAQFGFYQLFLRFGTPGAFLLQAGYFGLWVVDDLRLLHALRLGLPLILAFIVLALIATQILSLKLRDTAEAILRKAQ